LTMRTSQWATLLTACALLAAPLADDFEDEANAGMSEEDRDNMQDTDVPISAEELQVLHEKLDIDKDKLVTPGEMLLFYFRAADFMSKIDLSFLTEIDHNKDGKLSLKEHLADLDETGNDEHKAQVEEWKRTETAKFQAADRDKDGVLAEDEIRGLFFPETHTDVLSVVVAEAMKEKDKDQDGKLSLLEFWMGVDELTDEDRADFTLLDKDENGFIDSKELGAWESGQHYSERTINLIFKLADKDGDKQLTVDEFTAAAEKFVGTEAHYHLQEWMKVTDKEEL